MRIECSTTVRLSLSMWCHVMNRHFSPPGPHLCSDCVFICFISDCVCSTLSVLSSEFYPQCSILRVLSPPLTCHHHLEHQTYGMRHRVTSRSTDSHSLPSSLSHSFTLSLSLLPLTFTRCTSVLTISSSFFLLFLLRMKRKGKRIVPAVPKDHLFSLSLSFNSCEMLLPTRSVGKEKKKKKEKTIRDPKRKAGSEFGCQAGEERKSHWSKKGCGIKK